MCADSCFISFEMALDSHQDLEAFLALSQRELCMMRVVRVLADFLNYLLSVPAPAAWSICAVESARETKHAMVGSIPGNLSRCVLNFT
jgi:hypothetical protein